MKNHDSFYQNEATIRNGYFFYNRMATDYNNRYAEYYYSAEDEILAFLVELQRTKVGKVGSLTRLWQIERQKEIKAFNKFFKTDTVLDFNSPNIGKQLIEAYNYTLQIRDIYDRNKALFQHLTSQAGSVEKGVTAYFPSYFDKVWRSETDGGTLGEEIATEISKQIDFNTASSADIRRALKDILAKRMPEIYQKALNEMFGPNTDLELSLRQAGLSKEEYSRLRNAYSSLLPVINSGEANSNPIIQNILKIYNFNGLSEVIMERLKEGEDTITSIKDSIQDKVHGKGGKDSRGVASKGGEFAEVLAVAMEKAKETILEGIASGNMKKKIKITGERTGQTGSTPDFVFTVGVDNEETERLNKEIQNIIKTTRSNSGKDNMINNFSQLGEKLSQTEDNLIIYVNSKFYSLNDNFEKYGGYSAGEARNLRSFLTNIPTIQDVDGLLSAVINTTKGSINNESTQESVSAKIASLIAYYLFDDYVSLGGEIAQENQGFGIHLMYLNNTYVPLSVLLQQLDKAIQAAQISMNNTVSVRITIPKVEQLYQARPHGQRGGGKYDSPQTVIEHWTKQRNSAQRAADKIVIRAHFFQNMKNIIAGLTS